MRKRNEGWRRTEEASAATYRSNAAHPTFESLDEAFCDSLEHIKSGYDTLERALKIRVEAWIVKLNGPHPLPSVAWRKNRNAFAALLARAIEEVDFREPFDKRPPEGSLPTLAPHLRLRIPDRSSSLGRGRTFWGQQRDRLDNVRGRCVDPSEIAIDPPRTFQRERWRGWNTSAATTSSSRRALDGGNVARRCPSQREWFESSMSSGCTGRAQEEHCFHSPGGSARGKGFLVVECEWCKGDAAARIQALQETVAKQTLQIEALGVRQAFRETKRMEESKSLQHARLREATLREVHGPERFRTDEDEEEEENVCAKGGEVKVDGLEERCGTADHSQHFGPSHPSRRAAALSRTTSAASLTGVRQKFGTSWPRDGDVQGWTRNSSNTHPPAPHRASASEGLMDPDLEQRLERFEEDARVLVDIVKRDATIERFDRAGNLSLGPRIIFSA